jgi:hypothetical protein
MFKMGKIALRWAHIQVNSARWSAHIISDPPSNSEPPPDLRKPPCLRDAKWRGAKWLTPVMLSDNCNRFLCLYFFGRIGHV